MANDPAAATATDKDGKVLGTPAILKSPLVTAAPERVNRPVPVPSIYKDERGEIHNIRVGNQRINVLYTKEGVMRSGDLHSNTQHDFIFSGRVELWILSNNGDKTFTKKTLHGPGDYIQVPPYVPHVFHFLQDTTMAEWWTPGSFFAWFYQPYREEVQKSFACSRPGIMQQLGPISETKESVSRRLLKKLAGVSAGVAAFHLVVISAGCAAGYLAARHRK